VSSLQTKPRLLATITLSGLGMLTVIRLPCDRRNPLSMPLEVRSKWLPGLWVPDADGLVHTATRELVSEGRERDAQHPSGMALQRVFRSSGICIPYPDCVVAAARGEDRGGDWRELRREDRLSVAGNAMGHARNRLDLEHSLRLGAQSNSRSARALATPTPYFLTWHVLKGVGNAMLFQQTEEVCRVLIDNNVLSGDVYAKAVRGKVFAVLEGQSQPSAPSWFAIQGGGEKK